MAVVALKFSNAPYRAAVVVLVAVVRSETVVLLSPLVGLLRGYQFILEDIVFVFQDAELDFIVLFQICYFLLQDFQLRVTIDSTSAVMVL
jgi:hypothetical protein